MQNNSIGLSVLWACYTSMIPGMSVVEHSHPFFHFGCLFSGRVQHLNSGVISPERWIFCAAPGQNHHGFAILDEEVPVFDCKFTVPDPQLYKRIEHFPFHRITLDKTSEKLLRIMISDIQNGPISAELLSASFYYFITRLMDINAAALIQDTEAATDICIRVKQYIDANYSADISLDQLADIAGVSRNYLCHIFSKTQNMTTVDYLNKVRIRAACDMISYTDAPIKDIYKACGFGDLHHFGRVFKQIVGVPPGIYRQTHDTNVNLYSGDLINLTRDDSKKGYFTYAAIPQKFIAWKNHFDYLNQKNSQM